MNEEQFTTAQQLLRDFSKTYNLVNNHRKDFGKTVSFFSFLKAIPWWLVNDFSIPCRSLPPEMLIPNSQKILNSLSPSTADQDLRKQQSTTICRQQVILSTTPDQNRKTPPAFTRVNNKQVHNKNTSNGNNNTVHNNNNNSHNNKTQNVPKLSN